MKQWQKIGLTVLKDVIVAWWQRRQAKDKEKPNVDKTP